MNIEVTGLDEAINLLNRIQKITKSTKLKEYIAERAIEEINKIAKSKLSQNDNYINSNKYTLTEKGILIYNDVKTEDGSYYSLIIEYGSGTNAEMNHIGGTNKFIESGYTYWFTPESVAPQIGSYNYKEIITENGEKLYMVFGQRPKHIYTDASKIIERNLIKWASEFIGKEIK